MQTAEQIVTAFREQKPLRIRSMKWNEFIEMLEEMKKIPH